MNNIQFRVHLRHCIIVLYTGPYTEQLLFMRRETSDTLEGGGGVRGGGVADEMNREEQGKLKQQEAWSVVPRMCPWP